MSSVSKESSLPTQIGAGLSAALQATAKGNSHTTASSAAILWPDKERQWQSVLPALLRQMPNLYVLGPYDPDKRSGPAIWLKCVIANALQDMQLDDIPVIYLPGVSRAEMRAIESCSRDLQPLAELQYRGVFWSQANAKDWTLNAFFSSANGGLGLDVSQDKATAEALGQALEAGVLLDRLLDDFKGRQINAEWLLSLMAPNPTRDLLAWLNQPEVTQQQWSGVRWQVFSKRCKKDYGFDPVSDGVLSAAERLAAKKGAWAAVAELYHDSHSSFPNIYNLLKRIQPPQYDLLTDLRELAGYPQVNESHEVTLRYALNACKGKDAQAARNAILSAYQEHGVRRNWLWATMGYAPLAQALGYLAEVAEATTKLPIGSTPADLAQSYQSTGWVVDAAALNALAAIHSQEDTEAVSAALRAVYLPWLDASALRLQTAVSAAGGLNDLPTIPASKSGVCTVFIDGLRYDVAQALQKKLVALGEVSLTAHWTSLPSVTASGKPWCSPVKALISGTRDDVEFQPRVTADGKPLSGHNFRKLLAEQGADSLDKSEVGNPALQAWTEVGNLDHYGHAHELRLARDMESQLALIVERITQLVQAGWRHLRIVTDHGWLLLPGGLPKSELSKHQAETKWGRCAVLKDTAHATELTFGWSWYSGVQIAYAPGVSSFIAGAQYAHGGISFQECLVPMIELVSAGEATQTERVTITGVTWKGLRCMVEVAEELSGLEVDIRTKPALASSSVVAQCKPLVSRKASLAVADDELEGSAAVIVILGAQGEVLQRLATTIGG